MPMTNTSKTITLLVQRQLDAITTGNGAFLETFLRTAKAPVSGCALYSRHGMPLGTAPLLLSIRACSP